MSGVSGTIRPATPGGPSGLGWFSAISIMRAIVSRHAARGSTSGGGYA
jgi:hypothetical protein